MKKREGQRVIVEPMALARMNHEQCPACGKPKPEWARRTDWRCCSTECTSAFGRSLIWYSWGQYRERVFERDHYKCVKCGTIPERAYNHDRAERCQGTCQLGPLFLRVDDDKCVFADPSQLVADHIITIALGGDEWDMNNIQTLCIECNKKKTSEDLRSIAAQRRIESTLHINTQVAAFTRRPE